MRTGQSRQRGAIAWMAYHPVAANLAMVFCLLGGYFMMLHVTKEVFPDVQDDLVQISMSYPGASPEEVEQAVVLAIEENVRGLDGVKEVTSVAGEGSARVTVEVLEGEDLQRLSQEIKSEVDRIRTFPEDAEEPEIEIVSRRRRVLSLQLYGSVDEVVLRELAEQARDRLLQDPEITQVDLRGVRPLEISIEVPQENLRRYNLTLSEIASRLRSASVEVPGGGLKTEGGEVLVRMKERRDYGRQFARTPIISAPDGSQVLLEDIAVIKDEFADVDRFGLYNGKPSINLAIYRVGKQTPIQVSEAAHRQIDMLNQILPGDVRIEVLDDRADIYRQRVQLLLRNGTLGLCLVLLSLGLFLELRLAFWVMMGIPISFLGSMLFLPTLGVSINMISMFAYIIALGIVVDDAIVIGENIYYHHENGKSFQEAAVAGARELAVPVTFSILTNVATFMPLYFIPGMMGKIFKMIPLVVITVFMISLMESIFVLPAHLGHHRDKKRRGLNRLLHSAQQAFGKAFIRAVRDLFGPFLDTMLKRRYVVVSVATAVLTTLLSWPLSGRMGFSLFPRVESDFARAGVVLPYGSAVAKTEAIGHRLYEGARQVVDECGHPELVEGIFMSIGEEGGHTAVVEVFLADAEIRDPIMSTDEFCQRWRDAVGPVLGVESLVYASDFGGPGHGSALTVELSHRSIAVLERASAELAEALANFPSVKDIEDGFQPGKQQIDFKIKPEGKALGLTAQDVAREVRNAFYGAEVVRQQRGRNEIKVMVRLPEEERISEHDLDRLMIRTPAGTDVPLNQVVEAKRGRAYTTIDRRDGRRVVQVEADVVPRSRALEVLASIEADELPALKRKYPGLTYTFEGRQADMRESMASLKGGFIMALVAVFALLAIPFRSYIQPLIIMVSIPFGIIGAIIGHLIMGYSLSVVSMFGIVALSGVVVNDALVLIDAANRRLREGLAPHDAVLQAAIQRFRPIMLTTLTTFCGLAPMIFETSRQARFLIPMALSLGFGIVFATVITLILVPSLYLVANDVYRLLGVLRGEHHEEAGLPEQAQAIDTE
ncbi:MAG: efflux RND transporter permease subunit [Candidatus Hydrogenedentes bacterium]|nr:efflux RND transporter permease subunit [Candidatus Hydrogenedentota bacterium]